MLAECTRFNESRWCRTFRMLQDEQLSNTFPLHNDKQQRQSSFPTMAKLEYFPELGGARRDRTDDLKLAKLPLSQLSYGPI